MASSHVKWSRQHSLPTTWPQNTLPPSAGHWIISFIPWRHRRFHPKIKFFFLLIRQPFALTWQLSCWPQRPWRMCLYRSFLSTDQTGLCLLPPSVTSKVTTTYMSSFVHHPTNIIWPPHFNPKNEGTKLLPNASTHLQNYKVPKSRKPQSDRDCDLIFMFQHESFLPVFENVSESCVLHPILHFVSLSLKMLETCLLMMIFQYVPQSPSWSVNKYAPIRLHQTYHCDQICVPQKALWKPVTQE